MERTPPLGPPSLPDNRATKSVRQFQYHNHLSRSISHKPFATESYSRANFAHRPHNTEWSSLRSLSGAVFRLAAMQVSLCQARLDDDHASKFNDPMVEGAPLSPPPPPPLCVVFFKMFSVGYRSVVAVLVRIVDPLGCKELFQWGMVFGIFEVAFSNRETSIPRLAWSMWSCGGL